MCGNYYSRGGARNGDQGSPPRVRELRDGERTVENLIGITPACAGITQIEDLVRPLVRDHPRVCGNY